MEPVVLDSNLYPFSIVDVFESLIWTERYSTYGDFEIYTSVSSEYLNALQEDYFLSIKESNRIMIIEDIQS